MTKLEKIYELMGKYWKVYNFKTDSRSFNLDEETKIYESGNDIYVDTNDSYWNGYGYTEILPNYANMDKLNEYMSRGLSKSYSFKDVDELFDYILKQNTPTAEAMCDDINDFLFDNYNYYVNYSAPLYKILNDDYNNYCKYDAAYCVIKEIQEIFSPCKKELLAILNDEDIEDINESFIYEKLENNSKLKLQDMSSKDATHITVKRYKDNEQLFDIKQETDEDDLHFYVRIDNGKETFEYSRKIETQQDFIKALEQTISALENYNEFSSYKDDLIDVLNEFK